MQKGTELKECEWASIPPVSFGASLQQWQADADRVVQSYRAIRPVEDCVALRKWLERGLRKALPTLRRLHTKYGLAPAPILTTCALGWLERQAPEGKVTLRDVKQLMDSLATPAARALFRGESAERVFDQVCDRARILRQILQTRRRKTGAPKNQMVIRRALLLTLHVKAATGLELRAEVGALLEAFEYWAPSITDEATGNTRQDRLRDRVKHLRLLQLRTID